LAGRERCSLSAFLGERFPRERLRRNPTSNAKGKAFVYRLVPAAVILLAPMGMLYPLWSNPVSAGEDDVVYYYPLRKMVAEALGRGEMALYNPREATGAALMADPQAAAMYPPTWLFVALPDKGAYSLSIFLAFSIAGGGAYLTLRRLGLIRPAALFGAIAFMFCGFMIGHRVHLAVIHTACWLGWGLWCIEGFRRRWLAAMCWFVPIGYLAITAGHWPTLVHVGLIWAGYVLLRGRPRLRTCACAVVGLLLAAMLAYPQIAQTIDLLSQTTRQRIGYATAGQNSFFPVAGVLALFPMLMGSRIPGFYPQGYWGPAHHCEMLGYVGLSTLCLAGAAVWWALRNKQELPHNGDENESPGAMFPSLRLLVRRWTWLTLAAMVFMLGYYLPTYRLIHAIPILATVRCPARMVLAVEMALAVLAAVAIHLLAVSHVPQAAFARVSRLVRRMATILLPLTMLGVLIVLVLAAWMLQNKWPELIPQLTGGAEDMIQALQPANPAVWVPIMFLVVTALAVLRWLKQPAGRVPLLVVILLADLFFVARFVDIPPAGTVACDPEQSPAAAWLKANTTVGPDQRVWGLSENYHHRPAELLLPKTACSLGLSTINSYGPFLSPDHAQLLGFRIFGNTPDWARLVRRNYLLSLYGVRYIVTADPICRRVIESVAVPTHPPSAEGENLLAGRWQGKRSVLTDGVLRLRAPTLWLPATAHQTVVLTAGDVYRIAMDVRGPDGGAADSLYVKVLSSLPNIRRYDAQTRIVYGEQTAEDWRHFEWTFAAPPSGKAERIFHLWTVSERPIEVANISLRASHWPRPILLDKRLAAGEKIYRKLTELPARRIGDLPVAIYENLLVRPALIDTTQADPTAIETLKWRVNDAEDLPEHLPDLSLGPGRPLTPNQAILPGLSGAIYFIILYFAMRYKKKQSKSL